MIGRPSVVEIVMEILERQAEIFHVPSDRFRIFVFYRRPFITQT